jgi:hypothetical protein
MAQLKFVEAEPFLIAGFEGLLQRKAVLPARVSLREAGDRIVELYTKWGKPEEAAEWRKKVDSELKGAN